MNRVGTCMYCGQERMVEATTYDTLEELSEKATQECTCKEGETERERKKRIVEAKTNIDSIFSEYQETRELLHKAIEPASMSLIRSIQIDTGDGVKGKLSITNDGKIKVERTETSKIIRTSNA